jgi:predicted protein tyrosine phosphatase
MTPTNVWEKRRVLTVCQRGNSRSVALGWILKDGLGAEALCAGVETSSPATLAMLCEWAEVVIVVDARLTDRIPVAYAAKLLVWDVGRDVYFRGFDDRLVAQFEHFLEQHVMPTGACA